MQPNELPRVHTGNMSMARGFGIAVLCMLLNMADGYDLFIIGFALPHLPAGYATSGEKGLMISAGLLGMAVGAILLARMADRVGRRKTALAGIALNAIGLALSAISPNAELMMTTRFITGVGIGMISVVIVVAAQENAPRGYRNLSTAIVMVGFPLGSILAGFFTAELMSALGGAWQSLFWAGVVMAVVAFALTAFGLPDSDEFLARRRGAATTTVDTAPIAGSETDTRLLGPALRRITILLAVGYTLLSAAYYFVGTWTPQLITTATHDKAQGAHVGLLVSLGTLVGVTVFAVLSLRLSTAVLAMALSLLGAASVIAFAVLLPSGSSHVFAFLLGGAVFGTMSCYTAIAPGAYPVLARAKGYGAMMGTGRLGAIGAPMLAGFALDAGVSNRTLFSSTAVVLTIVAVTTGLMLRGMLRSTKAAPAGQESTAAAPQPSPAT